MDDMDEDEPVDDIEIPEVITQCRDVVFFLCCFISD